MRSAERPTFGDLSATSRRGRRCAKSRAGEFAASAPNSILTPYREDQQQVATELLQQLPSHQLTLSVLYPEGERPIVEEPASRRGQLFEPTSGGAVLALTDLGSLAGDSGESAAFWGRLGVWLAHRGCQRIALVPCRICDVPESLAALWQLIPWERSSGATVTEHGLTADAFTQLMASLSQAGRIEPRLLRHVRKLLKRVLAHAGLEGRFWSHGDLYGRHPAGATLRA
ncbi:MAG: hypothetical protein NT069_18045, partial [Planctomycetota bacterium]|nr:hypothetical protein [Planctomycetota bacterium]